MTPSPSTEATARAARKRFTREVADRRTKPFRVLVLPSWGFDWETQLVVTEVVDDPPVGGSLSGPSGDEAIDSAANVHGTPGRRGRMSCPYLEYRAEADDRSFEVARPYCTVVDRFVQPMRADVCNDRYDLDHESHCEYYRAEVCGDESRIEDQSIGGGGEP